ncbi:MAG: replication factor C large subunit [Nitrososphaeria archaeon]|nr:replication factor C large subunit [Nitrososphaeria archaeon]
MTGPVRQLPWAEKYRPRRVSEIVGNKEAVEEFVRWMRAWESGRVPERKAALLHGPPGTGKTSLVLAYAEEHGYDLVQVNASDRRTPESLEEVLGHAISSTTVFGRRRMVLVDEVEGAVLSAESGTAEMLRSLIQRTSVPMVLTANDVWEPNVAPLRERCLLIEFGRLRPKEIAERLREIARREGLGVDDGLIEAIAERARGDMRAAINDLQATAMLGGGLRALEAMQSRDVELNAFELMARVFGAKRLADGRGVLANTDLDPETALTWVFDNVQTQIRDPRALEEAYRVLADADLHLRRASRFQRWELMKYGTVLLSAGPGVVKASTGEKGGRLEFPSRIRFLQQTRAEREAIRSVLAKVAQRTHMSTSKAATEFIPYLRLMLKAGDGRIAKALGLTEREVEVLAARAPELGLRPLKAGPEEAAAEERGPRARAAARARRARRG